MRQSPATSDPLARLSRGLEPAQVAVLEHDFEADGPLLVLAGAGTGKTTTLTRRVALELARGTPPDGILALTFTRKAATEMRERVGGLLDPGAHLPEIRTFHALGLSLLSDQDGRGWRAAGWTAPPRLLDEAELAATTAAFWRERFREDPAAAPSPAAWTKLLAEWAHPERYAAAGSRDHLETWRRWEAWKRGRGIADLRDLVGAALLALERDGLLLERWRHRATTIFVDEYQDTDRGQYRLVHLLAGSSRRLMAVGDDDQAIYGFRGADLRNLLDWKADHPDGRILSLTGNHRSLAPVLDASNRIFPDKPPEFRKFLQARRGAGDTAPRPIWYRAADPAEELDWIRGLLAAELRGGAAPADLCVLFRSNREEPALRRALEGLPLADGGGDGICLSTIHAAKGLEWPAVVVVSQDRPREEGAALAPFAQDEERRLFYVACTRARDRLYLTSSATRPQGKVSRPRRAHPWMDLVADRVEVRPHWLLRGLRGLWEPAARRARRS